MRLEQQLDPKDSGDWILVDDTPDFRRYELDLGDGKVIRRTEHKNTQAMLENNQRQLNDSQGQRWGDGKVIGRIPMNLYYTSGLAQAQKEGDQKWVSRFWNDADHRRFRTFGGNV